VIADLLTGLGLVAVIEGLVLALAPLRFEDVLAMLAKMSEQARRFLGLAMLAVGVALVAIARYVIA
jgi:uncharacterized protein